MMRYYLLCYDICDPKRWRLVHDIAKGYGAPLQYSVFQCILSNERKVLLLESLRRVIKHDEDSVLVIDLADAQAAEPRMTRMGKQAHFDEPGPVIL
jgi:CRISPR-associated protein Cas2